MTEAVRDGHGHFAPMPQADRFWAKVRKTDGCWEWQRARVRQGYGRFVLDGKVRLAHRVAWELTNGPIPTGLFVCHTCDNPPCVRLDHLFLGTRSENMEDASRKGRLIHQKLTPELVVAIRAEVAAGVSPRVIARRLGLHTSSIEHVASRRVWTHV